MALPGRLLARLSDGKPYDIEGNLFRVVGNQVGLILIKAKPEKLVQHLVDDIDTNIDAHYVEDFLLMYRVFIFEPSTILQRLIDWFNDPNHRDRVARIVLLWLNNHFNDFECNKEMLKLLENFENVHCYLVKQFIEIFSCSS